VRRLIRSRYEVSIARVSRCSAQGAGEILTPKFTVILALLASCSLVACNDLTTACPAKIFFTGDCNDTFQSYMFENGGPQSVQSQLPCSNYRTSVWKKGNKIALESKINSVTASCTIIKHEKGTREFLSSGTKEAVLNYTINILSTIKNQQWMNMNSPVSEVSIDFISKDGNIYAHNTEKVSIDKVRTLFSVIGVLERIKPEIVAKIDGVNVYWLYR
jgi:hypothetical protein